MKISSLKDAKPTRVMGNRRALPEEPGGIGVPALRKHNRDIDNGASFG
jgi:hypothetical protein